MAEEPELSQRSWFTSVILRHQFFIRFSVQETFFLAFLVYSLTFDLKCALFQERHFGDVRVSAVGVEVRLLRRIHLGCIQAGNSLSHVALRCMDVKNFSLLSLIFLVYLELLIQLQFIDLVERTQRTSTIVILSFLGQFIVHIRAIVILSFRDVLDGAM